MKNYGKMYSNIAVSLRGAAGDEAIQAYTPGNLFIFMYSFI